MISRGTRLIISIIVSVLFVFGAVFFTVYEVNHIEHRWCATLELLTKNQPPHGGNPSKNPSRKYVQQFYRDLINLEHSDGCTK